MGRDLHLEHISRELVEARRDRDAVIRQAQDARQSLDQLQDKIDGLEADLESAVKVAFKHGATDWCRLNYPVLFARFSKV